LDPEILVILLEFFFTVTSSGIAKPEATYRKKCGRDNTDPLHTIQNLEL
jgi:hypothetical protein